MAINVEILIKATRVILQRVLILKYDMNYTKIINEMLLYGIAVSGCVLYYPLIYKDMIPKPGSYILTEIRYAAPSSKQRISF